MATVAEVIKKIKKYTRCYKIREGNRHEIWFNPDTGVEFPIPRHYGKELKKGTEISILKDAGLK